VVQPLPDENVITAVPTFTPVTIPVVDTVATAVLLLLHAPPPMALLKVVVIPLQTSSVPVIDGAIPTVTV
jgi:hypothetical protein